MAKFRYSLQSILNIKMKMETQAKQEFSAAVNALDEEEKRLSEMNSRRADLETKAKELRQGRLNFRELEDNKRAIFYVDDRIVGQKVRVQAAEKNVEAAREALAEVMKERKTHEILREKAFEAFLLEENRAESKAVDELTSYNYGQKQHRQDTENQEEKIAGR